MLHLPTVAALTSLTLGAAVLAQAPEKTEPKTPAAATEQGAQRSTDDWIQQLGSDSFRDRARAERALRGLGEAALPDLRKAAESGDPEAQWRARRLIRQIEGGKGAGLQPRDRGDTRGDDGTGSPNAGNPGPLAPGRNGWRMGQPGGDVQDRFEGLFRDLERDFGLDVPRGHFFRDDFFQDLQQQMQDMQQRMQSMPMGGLDQGQSMSMQMGPDGVRVEVKSRDQDGKEESKVYEAPDLKTFQEKYPGVLGQHGFGFGTVPQLDDGRVFRTPRLSMPQLRTWTPLFGRDQDAQDDAGDPTDLAPATPAPLPPAGKRLGVVVRPEIPASVRDYLGIDHGLMVQQVQDGTLAQALGIEVGDIVTAIGARDITSTADVQDALGAIATGGRVEVKVLRRGGEVTLHATKSEAAGESAPAPLQKRKAEAGQDQAGKDEAGKGAADKR